MRNVFETYQETIFCLTYGQNSYFSQLRILEDMQCAETNEKSIFRFDFCDFYFLSYGRFCSKFSSVFNRPKFFFGISKDALCSESDYCIPELFIVRFLIFEVW